MHGETDMPKINTFPSCCFQKSVKEARASQEFYDIDYDVSYLLRAKHDQNRLDDVQGPAASVR